MRAEILSEFDTRTAGYVRFYFGEIQSQPMQLMPHRRANLYLSQVEILNRIFDAKSRLRRLPISGRERKSEHERLKALQQALLRVEKQLLS